MKLRLEVLKNSYKRINRYYKNYNINGKTMI